MKQILVDIKGESHSTTVVIGDFTTSLISTDKPSGGKINKKTAVLNDILDPIDLIDIFMASHPKTAE